MSYFRKSKRGLSFFPSQHHQKLLAVLVIKKDVLPSITPGSDMIERPGKFNAERSSHAGESSLPAMQETRSDPYLFLFLIKNHSLAIFLDHGQPK
jgi:hypothetical protein